MSDLAVRLHGVSKKYKIFKRRSGYVFDSFGLAGLGGPRRDFWALRGVDLELARGHRIGIIGRNGAGKTTLLKLITGNLPPTEGTVEVNGDVHALLDVSGGFHPEFTGRENVRAALIYQGLGNKEISAAEKDILEFTELGQFFDQPFKTYSLGMQARLTFACATAFTPDVLIVDEVLGAGDAAFYRRSTERMRQLMHTGASVLLVSHALPQIQRFCAETAWLERGEIVMRGPTTEVVKAYEKFTRDLDEAWLHDQRESHVARALQGAEGGGPSVSDWTDLPGVRIQSTSIEGETGIEKTVFRVGEPFRVRLRAVAETDGRHPVTPVALVYRPDGLIVTRHIGPTYEFWLLPPGSSTWQPAQAYSSSSTYAWTTAGKAAGKYTFSIWARDASSPGTAGNSLGRWDAYTTLVYTLTATPCTGVGASTSGSLTITATASGCPHPSYEFFVLYPGSSAWQLAQAYSTSPTLSWNTAGKPRGTYHFSIWARDASSPGTAGNPLGRWDAYTAINYSLA